MERSAILFVLSAVVSGQSPPDITTTLQPQPADTAQLQLRQARSALFDNSFGVSDHPTASPIESEAPGTPPRITMHNVATVAELPSAFADTILVGRITGFQSYQSNDHRSIYSEGTIQVEDVASQMVSHAAPGGSVVFEQAGGSLMLPNGRVLTHRSMGLGAHFQVGGRYAFFLTYVAKGQCFKLTKAWWLNNGRANAMAPDDLGRVQNGTSKYNGIPEPTFLNVLKSLQAAYVGN